MDDVDVLIVDDDGDFRTLLRALLEDQGCVVREAEDGTAALEMMRAQAPDLVVLDLQMPGMDGWALQQAIASDDALAGVPIAVLSSRAPASKPATSRILHKPLDLPNLLALLDAIDSPTAVALPESVTVD